MTKEYLKYIWRSLRHNPIYTAINVLGLGLGLSITLIVILFLKAELNYDTFYPEYKNTYRFGSEFNLQGDFEEFAGSGIGLAPLMERDLGIISQWTRIGQVGNNVLLKFGSKAVYSNTVFFADSNYFDLFPNAFIYGDATTALTVENSIVITQSLALSLFGDQNPIGKQIRTNNSRFVVSAVVRDLPDNVHLRYDAIIPAFREELSEDDLKRSLWSSSVFTYVQLKEGHGIREVYQAFPDFYEKNMKAIGEAIGSEFKLNAERLDRIHYHSDSSYDLPHGRPEYLYVFGGIGLLILTLAMINYMNLATARGALRAKEVGVRTVLGSKRKDLILLFLGESVFTAAFATLLAVVSAEWALRSEALENMLQEHLQLTVWTDPWLIWGGFLTIIFVGVLSGIYPAFYLSSIPTVSAIRGNFKSGNQGLLLRRFLVGFQFTISISVVLLSLMMQKQLDFINKTHLGFEKQNMVLIPMQDTALVKHIGAFQERLEGSSDILSTSVAQLSPSEGTSMIMLYAENETGAFEREAIEIMAVGDDYFTTMKMTLVAGREFDASLDTIEEESIIVNEAYLDRFQIQNPIGKRIRWGLRENGETTRESRIVGVVSDFHTNSLHQEIRPLAVFYSPESIGVLHVRVADNRVEEALAYMESKWNELQSGRPFEFSFLDSSLDHLYREDKRQSRLIQSLTYVTIFISCLGLLGLASFILQQRYKEIGIRKVLGAGNVQIIWMVFKDVAILVITALVISIPISYTIISLWMENFAYSAPIKFHLYIWIGLIAMLFSFLVVLFHSLRVVKSNPVDILKYE